MLEPKKHREQQQSGLHPKQREISGEGVIASGKGWICERCISTSAAVGLPANTVGWEVEVGRCTTGSNRIGTAKTLQIRRRTNFGASRWKIGVTNTLGEIAHFPDLP